MNTNQCDIGLIGLGVMGENLVLNMESKGFSVAVFNRTTEVTEKFVADRPREKHSATRTLEEFVGALKKPRIAMMMVKAGPPVDSVIGQLAPLLEKGDVIIDGGKFSLYRHAAACRRIGEHRDSFCRHGGIRRRGRRA